MTRLLWVGLACCALGSCARSEAPGDGGGGGSSTGGGAAMGGGGGGSSTGGGSATGGGGGGNPCSGLDEASCKANPECVANYCDHFCTCGLVFHQCTLQNEQPDSCPHLDCVAPSCGDYDGGSCAAGTVCAAQEGASTRGFYECCGCDHPCSADAECDGGICAADNCGCGEVCQPSCQTAGCAIGEECQTNGHCAPTPCAADSQCPALFHCNASSQCERDSCTGTCDAGSCVNGSCWPLEGICRTVAQ